jgi:hypothetical protein
MRTRAESLTYVHLLKTITSHTSLSLDKVQPEIRENNRAKSVTRPDANDKPIFKDIEASLIDTEELRNPPPREFLLCRHNEMITGRTKSIH